jgi:hypothetical protein
MTKRQRGRKGQGKQGGQRNGSGSRPTVDLSGMLQRLGLPVPRLPFLLGSNRDLTVSNSVYPRMVKLDFPIIPQFLTIATGAMAQVISVSINLIEQVGGLQGLFAEYSIVGVIFELRCNASATPQGIYLAYLDEKGSVTPTATTALEAPHIEGLVSDTESPSSHRIMWKVADFLDMDWTSMASSSEIPVWLKLFTSTAATGTSASTGAQIIVTGSLALCLRGYVGQN